MNGHVALCVGVTGCLAVVAVLANLVGASAESEPGWVTDGPVIALGQDSEVYPLMEVQGRLRAR
jgi:hypothetical protein